MGDATSGLAGAGHAMPEVRGAAGVPSAPGSGARILVVDDEIANVRVLEHLLGRAGFTDVLGTTRSADALELVRQRAPDLLVLDLRMPPPDGLEVLRGLRGVLAPGEYLPVLIVTADAESEARRRALSAGAHDFLVKPYDAVEVVVRIRNLLRTRALHVELQRQNEALEERVRERTDRLLQVEKLSAMGQLLAGVAHELNNPLSVVHGQSRLLHGAPATSTAARAEKIMQASNTCVHIVQNFLKLARHWPAQRSRVDLDAVIREAVDLVAFELARADVAVRLDLAGDLPLVSGDPHQLHQVFLNLIVNALYAMRQAPGPRALEIRTRWEPDLVRIVATVRDSGPGVPRQHQRRIFDPFFTTKPAGEGTGLGLSLSAGIVGDHGGSLRLESAPGPGALFVVELPAGLGALAHRAGDRARRRTKRDGADRATDRIVGKRILVVDDERDVASLLADLLHLDGHEVDTAADGAAALEAVGAGDYDAVLSDMRMPVLDGAGFYRVLAARNPALAARVGFVTGDTLNADRREFLESAGRPIIGKPFEPDEVREVVQRLLRQ